MNVVDEIESDSDVTFKVTGLEDQSGSPITTAIITATIRDSNGSAIATLDYENVESGLNDYVAYLSAGTLTPGEKYEIEIEAQSLSGTRTWTLCVRAKPEKDCFS